MRPTATSVIEPMAAAATRSDVPSGHIVAIDGARGLAMLLVFFGHAYPCLGGLAPANSVCSVVLKLLATIANAGVTVFFVISGYLIYGILLDRPARYLSFLRRRVARIFPTFLVVFTIYLALTLALPQQNKLVGTAVNKAFYLLANLFLLPGIFPITPFISVAWTLSYEFLYYLVVPGFVALRKFVPSSYRVVALFLLGLLLIGFSFRAGLGSIVLGMAICELGKRPFAKRGLAPWVNVVSVLTLPATAVLAYYAFSTSGHISTLNRLTYALLSINVSVLAFYAFRFRSHLSTILSFSPLLAFGRISYSYYLIHGLTLKAAVLLPKAFLQHHYDGGTLLLALVLGFGATCASGTLLYWTVEQPFSNSKAVRGKSSSPA